MLKNIYKFLFVALIAGSFFVVDKALAYTFTHEGNITIEKPNSLNTEQTMYSEYLNVINYYNENLKDEYPYYLFYITDSLSTRFIFRIFKSYGLSSTNGFGFNSDHWVLYGTCSSSSTINPSNFNLIEKTCNNGNFNTVDAIYYFNDYFETLSGSNYTMHSNAIIVADTNLTSSNKSYTSLTINNVTYGLNDVVDLTPIDNSIQYETKIDSSSSGSSSEQIYSLDVYLDKTIENDGKYNFSLTVEDDFDYSTTDNQTHADITGFAFKGLVNDNGLYHWETIPVSNDFYVDYDNDDWIYNTVDTCLISNGNGTDSSSSGSSGGGHSGGSGYHDDDCVGFKFSGNFNYDMTNYEQIKLSIVMHNMRNYVLKFEDDYDSDSNDYIDLNYSFLGDNTGQKYGRTSSKGYRYMFFSSYGDLVNTDINNNYVIVRSNHYNQYNDIPIFFNKFNTSSYSFLDYDDNNVLKLKKINDYTYLRYAFEIGTTSATGFYIDLNANDIFYYQIYIPDNLYFSYTNDVTESSFVNSSGEVVDDGIFPNTDIGITNINSYSNIFESAIHYFTDPIRFIFLYFGDFFDTLPIAFKYSLISIFTISIIFVVIKYVI